MSSPPLPELYCARFLVPDPFLRSTFLHSACAYATGWPETITDAGVSGNGCYQPKVGRLVDTGSIYNMKTTTGPTATLDEGDRIYFAVYVGSAGAPMTDRFRVGVVQPCTSLQPQPCPTASNLNH